MGIYLRPTELEEATEALASQPFAILAGGTDFFPARVGRTIDEDVLDISGVAALRGISETPDQIRIGARMTWTDILDAELPPWCEALKLAAREVGGMQIQNAGTIAGNLCNASPAADGVPPLLAFDSAVELASVRGTRTVPLGEFILGNRRTARRPEELVTAVLLPRPTRPARSTFLKLGARKYLVISIVMVATLIEDAADGTIAAARVAVGSCSKTALRLAALEAALVGQRASAALVDDAYFAPLAPLDDVRGTAAYRREAARTLVARSLRQLGG
jgi:CO/xanthine dehydrogenase FAD-binding subunit